MKILIINDYKSLEGGVESYLSEIIPEIKKDHKVKLFYWDKEPKGLSYPLKFINILAFFNLKKIIKEFKPDIIHSYNIGRSITPLFMITAKKNKIPIIQSLRDFHYICPKSYMLNKKGEVIKKHNSYLECVTNHIPKRGFVYDSLKYFKVFIHKKIISKNLPLFITPSEYLSKWVKEIFKTNKVKTLPNPALLNYNGPIEYKNRKHFLYVGRLSQEKGLKTLIYAFKKVSKKYKDEKLIICGNGAQKNELIRLIKKLNMGNKIILKGKVSRKNLGKYYKNAKATIVPSEWLESYGNVVIESFVYGTPVITSNVGEISEIVKRSKAGITFKMKNIFDLESKINSILENKNKTNKMSVEGRNYVKRLSLKQHIKELINIYKSQIKDGT